MVLRGFVEMRRPSLLPAVFAGLLFWLGACAGATPYQAAVESTYGYKSQQIETDRWSVTFAGNSLTQRETVETYLLYRAAELTDQQGFDHFKVVTRETEASRRVIQTGFSYDPYYDGFACRYRFYGRAGLLRRDPFLRHRRLAFRRYDPFYDPFFDPFLEPGYDVHEIIRYEASAEIVMGRGEAPGDEAYFSADEVLANLAGQIIRPDPAI